MRAEGDDLPFGAGTYEIVQHFARKVNNGRKVDDAYRHLLSEVVELEDEIALAKTNQSPGADGIIGEAIDIIACAMDVIFLQNPEITEAEVNAYLIKKCQKWLKHYSHSVDKRIFPNQIGQKVKICPERITETELVLDQEYEIHTVTTYDWQEHQPSKVTVVGEPEAIFAADLFYVVEE